VLKIKMADQVDFGEEPEEEDELDWNEIQTYHDQTITNATMKTQNDGLNKYGNIVSLGGREPNHEEVSTEIFEIEKPETTCTTAVNMTSGPSRMSLNDHKAGMEGLDKEKINKVIFEASKGSKFYENELQKEQQVKDRIQRQTERLESCTDEEKAEAMIQADRVVKELEETRDLSRTIVHIDMDAFYAAVEMRDDPSLRDKPMAVGSTGMLSTSNYLARRFGVRAAMPGFIGKKLCPDLTIVSPHFDKYREASKIVRNVLRDYDPNFLPMSLDEAYLDLTEYIQERQKETDNRVFYKPPRSQNNGDASEKQAFEFGHSVEDIVEEIRFRIELDTHLTASAGIACNRMLAKVCTDRNKPNGHYKLPSDRDAVLQFVRDLPIRKISGIGRVSEQMLKALDITTCHDLYVKRGLLVLLNSNNSSRFLIAISLGLGETRLESTRERKSLGTERTFTEISNPIQLFNECQSLCKNVAKDCKEEELKPKTVTLKLKTVKFEVKTRSFSFPNPISTEREIWDAAKDLLSKEIKSCEPKLLRLRLMGVRLSNFEKCEKKDAKQDTITSFLQKGTLVSKQNMDGQGKIVLNHESKECELSFPEGACASNSVQRPSTSTSFQAVCPVCNTLQNIKDADYLAVFNKHVDSCLTNQSRVQKPCFEAVCPVCNDLQIIKDPDYLTVFNRHVDLCLNSGTIKTVLSLDTQHKDQGQTETTQPSTEGKSAKGSKRKQQNSKGTSRSKRATLERFWAK
jgi:DNA polymerase kappa